MEDILEQYYMGDLKQFRDVNYILMAIQYLNGDIIFNRSTSIVLVITMDMCNNTKALNATNQSVTL